MVGPERRGTPEGVDATDWTLTVAGTVDRPLELTRGDLESLPVETFGGDFACEEGWVAEGLEWRGVRVERILDRAGVTERGRYGLVRSMDGDYACGFEVERLAESVLALELDGDSLGVGRGGPARLVPTDEGRDCWESVKWVSAIELSASPPTEADTAEDLALSRIE